MPLCDIADGAVVEISLKEDDAVAPVERAQKALDRLAKRESFGKIGRTRAVGYLSEFIECKIRFAAFPRFFRLVTVNGKIAAERGR